MNYESRSSCMCVLGSNIGFFAKNDEETENEKAWKNDMPNRFDA